jgi:hypothetical protein
MSMVGFRAITLSAALAFSLAWPVLAEPAPPSAPAPAAVSPAGEKLALAQQLVIVIDAQGMMRRMTDAMTSQFSKSFSGTSGDSEMGSFMARLMNDEMETLIRKTLPQFVQVYADTFDVQDLRDLVAFYTSPLGKRLIEKGPELSRRGQSIMQPYLPGLQATLIAKTFDHVCEVKGCSADQRKAMEAVKLKMLEQIKAQAAAAAKSSI